MLSSPVEVVVDKALLILITVVVAVQEVILLVLDMV
jgi:hypothetical protein